MGVDSSRAQFSILDSYELDSTEAKSVTSVRGRLSKCISEWEGINAPGFILEVIREGYKIPFVSLPPPKHSGAVLDLLKMNCIEELVEAPDIVNPLSVSTQSSGKKRLILDLRHVNLYVYKQKFKCEDLKVTLSIISRGYSLFKFDLKSGYHHVEIFPEHRKFLAFRWGFGDGVIRYFQFAVLPFGLSSAPCLFTKPFKPVIKMWRSNGIPIVVFLDDGLGGGATELTAKIHSLKVHSDLIRFGFIVNLAKSHWDPSHVIVWLGCVIDTIRGTIAATDQGLRKFVNFIDFLSDCESRVVKARDLPSLIGMIISFSPFVGNVTRIMTRSLYHVLYGRFSWNSNVQLTDEAIREIMFWKLNARSLNGRAAWPTESKPSKIVYSDASDYACSSFVENEGKVFQQNWSSDERKKSSTWRELKAVQLAISSFAHDLKGQQVAWVH